MCIVDRTSWFVAHNTSSSIWSRASTSGWAKKMSSPSKRACCSSGGCGGCGGCGLGCQVGLPLFFTLLVQLWAPHIGWPLVERGHQWGTWVPSQIQRLTASVDPSLVVGCLSLVAVQLAFHYATQRCKGLHRPDGDRNQDHGHDHEDDAIIESQTDPEQEQHHEQHQEPTPNAEHIMSPVADSGPDANMNEPRPGLLQTAVRQRRSRTSAELRTCLEGSQWLVRTHFHAPLTHSYSSRRRQRC